MNLSRVCGALLVALSLFVGAAPSIVAQGRNQGQGQAQNQAQNQRNPQDQQDIEAVVRIVDGVVAGTQPAPVEVPITWESNHFVKGGDGSTYVPFTLTIDRSKLAMPNATALYVRVVDKNAPAVPPAPAPAAQGRGGRGGRGAAAPPPVTFPWDNLYFIEVPADGRVSRAMQLKPGSYEAFVLVKERTPAPPAQQQRNAPPPAPVATKAGLVRRDLTVPDFSTAELKTSSVILANTVEPLTAAATPAQQQESPYIFGAMKVVPASDSVLKKTEELQLVFWVYGAANKEGKPDVQIEYTFHRKTPEGDKYFNKTAPLDLNAQTLPPQFDANAGHQLPGIMAVPLASFPEGDYRIEIKVNDKVGGKSITENIPFSVVAG